MPEDTTNAELTVAPASPPGVGAVAPPLEDLLLTPASTRADTSDALGGEASLDLTRSPRVPGAPAVATPELRARAVRVLLDVATGVLLLFAAAVLQSVAAGSIARGDLGYDIGLYARIGAHWLATGDAYYPIQFAGPYVNAGEVNLYPPLALYFFVPFVWLPHVLWWLIPCAVIGSTLAWLRPARWSWPILAAVAATVPAAATLAQGDSELWVLAFVCLAFRWPAAAVLLAFKPDMFLFALPFAGRRSWWFAIVAVAVAAIPFGTLWIEWISAISNFRGQTVLYSLNAWPLVVALFVAYIARQRDGHRLSRPRSARLPRLLGRLQDALPRM